MAGLNIGNAPFWLSNQEMISKNEIGGTKKILAGEGSKGAAPRFSAGLTP